MFNGLKWYSPPTKGSNPTRSRAPETIFQTIPLLIYGNTSKNLCQIMDEFVFLCSLVLIQSTRGMFLKYLALRIWLQRLLSTNPLHKLLSRRALLNHEIFLSPQPPKPIGHVIRSNLTKWIFLSSRSLPAQRKEYTYFLRVSNMYIGNVNNESQ